MAFSELEIKRIHKTMDKLMAKRRPPEHIRPELDIGWRLDVQSVEIFERRPAYQQPDEIFERPIAKMTFIRATGLWKLFWQRQDLRWHGYQPALTHRTLDGAIQEVDVDRHYCFWG